MAVASCRLFETLVRPIDGAGVTFWSTQFEADAQALIERSRWAAVVAAAARAAVFTTPAIVAGITALPVD